MVRCSTIETMVPGFQTFGEDYQIDKPELEITVRLKRPGGQYSVYENHPDPKKAEDKKPDDKKSDEKKPAERKPQ